MAHKRRGAVKVGVIGYSASFNMGRTHLTEMKKAGMVPTAMAELDASRMKAAAEDFPGIETYPSVTEMLAKSDVELLALITPHNTHTELALQCLKAGRHVISEKPFAINTAQCDAMIATAKAKGLLLSAYHNRHWDGAILAAVAAVRSGVLGEVVRVETQMGGWGKPADWWRTSKSISGGILYDWGAHLLEYTLQIMNSEMTEVSGYFHTGFWAGQTPWKKDTIEDEGFLSVRYKSGGWSTLRISSLEHRPGQGWLTITGTQGSYNFDYHNYEMITHQDGKTITTRGKNPESEHTKFYQNVADYLGGRAKLIITPEWARRPVHIMDLAGQSATKGKALPVKYS